MNFPTRLLPVLFALSPLPFATAADETKSLGDQVRAADAILRVKVMETQVARAAEGKTSPVDTLTGTCEVTDACKGKPESGMPVEIRCVRQQAEFALIRKDGDYVMILDKPEDTKDKTLSVKAVYPVKDGKVQHPEDNAKEIPVAELFEILRGHDNGHG